MAFEFAGGAIVQGIVTLMAVKGVSNVVQGKDLFSDMGQSILMGGLTGGIFGGLGSGSSFGFENLFGSGAPATVGSATSGVPSAGIDALGNTGATSNLAINSGNAAVETAKNLGNNLTPGGMSDTFGFNPVQGGYNIAPPFSDAPVPDYTGDPEADLQAREYAGMQQPSGSLGAPSSAVPPPSTTDMPVIQPNAVGGYPKSSSGTSFMDDPLKWMNANKGKTALGAAAAAGAMGAFNRNTGLKNLPPRSYQRVNTSYNPGTVNPKYGMPGEPYFVGQGYGPETRETFYGAAGGGIRALSEGDLIAPYMPMTARGQMSWREDIPTDLDDSALNKKNSKYDINKKEKIGQAEIDKNVSSWLERYAKADVKGMAEGGPAQQVTQFQPTFSTAPQGIGSLQPYQAPNVPAMESSPTDYNQSSQYAPTQQYGTPTTSYSAPAANPMTAGLGSYLEGLKYKAPVTPVTPAPTTNTTSPAGYNPATQTYGTSPATPTTALPITPRTRLVPQGEDEPDKTQYLQPNGSYSDLSPALTGVTTRMVPEGDDGGSRMEYQLPDESWSSLHPALVGLNTREVRGEDDGIGTEYQSPDGNWSSANQFDYFDYASQNSKSPVTIYDPSTQRYIQKPVAPTSSTPDSPPKGFAPPFGGGEAELHGTSAPTAPPPPPSSTPYGTFLGSVNTREVRGEDDGIGTEYQSPDGSWSFVNPNPPVFDPFAINYDEGGGGGEKAGGPIASKRYAMGGLAALPEYAAGGKLLSGGGDGMSDSIPAVIKGARPQRAALADGEFVIPADVVSHLGNGSTKAGGKRLYEMMANIRKARTGNSKQGKQINPMKFIPT